MKEMVLLDSYIVRQVSMAVAQLYTVWVQPLVRNGSTVLVASIICMLLLVAYWHANNERPYPGFKLIGKEPEEWLHIRAKARFTNNAHSIMKRGYQEVSFDRSWSNTQAFIV